MKPSLLSAMVFALLLAVTACQSGPVPPDATPEAPSGRSPDASVSGAVTYRERLALTPDATLITNGNPDNVDMLLVLVEPPSEIVEGKE